MVFLIFLMDVGINLCSSLYGSGRCVSIDVTSKSSKLKAVNLWLLHRRRSINLVPIHSLSSCLVATQRRWSLVVTHSFGTCYLRFKVSSKLSRKYKKDTTVNNDSNWLLLNQTNIFKPHNSLLTKIYLSHPTYPNWKIIVII